jgi:hypothetical protein
LEKTVKKTHEQSVLENRGELTEEEARNANELLALMGNVLACWQGVEHVVADIYLIFFSPTRSDAASVAFFAVRTFESRLAVVNSLIEFFCSVEQKTRWNSLYTLARKRSTRRNAVAHGMVMRHGRPPRTEFVIGQNIYDISRFPDPPLKNGFYTRKELRDMCKLSLSLTKMLDDFRKLLAADHALRMKLDTQQQTKRNESLYPIRMQNPDLLP